MGASAARDFDGKNYVRTLTNAPGVYRMLDSQGRVLYIGKASNLKKRAASYFSAGITAPRIASMVSRIAAMEVTVTRTEGEALLLENELIKSLKPRYNVLLRDDKSYPFIYLASKEAFPRLAFHRGPQRAPGRYFGPFPGAGAVRDSLGQMQKLFRVRQCEDNFFRNRGRPCLQYQIKRCTAPCVGYVDEATYAEDVRHATMFLEGRSHSIIDELVARMDAASRSLDFERAADIRDRIHNLKKLQAQQYVAGCRGDLDIIAVAGAGATACVQVLFFRQGRNLGNRSFFPRNRGEQGPESVLYAFLSQYYLTRDLPPELVVSHPIADRSLLAEVFSQRAGRRVKIVVRPRTDKAQWLQMALRSADNALATQLASHTGIRQRIEALGSLLGLVELPVRMECFDVSHTRGEATVASCVVFDANGPVKSEYRRFNINGVQAGDDYAAMQQALARRYRRLKTGEGKIPDILFVDGGKGQVAQALAVLEELQIDQTLVVGIAKGIGRKVGQETLIVGRKRRVLRPDGASAAAHFIQWIRDEAHRFAIGGHRQRRSRARQRSVLEDIPGVGAKRRRALLSHFGGIHGVSGAGIEELCGVTGISRDLAQRIYHVLHGD